MKRLLFLLAVPIAVATIGIGAQDRTFPIVDFRHSFNVVEATIPEMQAALESGRLTSRELVLLYMTRIAQYEDVLNATAYVSRTALDEAELMDEERARGQVRGPLHGIPIAIKDNINTTNMPTTGGALMLAGFVPKFDASLVTSAACWRGDHRQDGTHRAGQLGDHQHAGELQRALRLWNEPLRSAA